MTANTTPEVAPAVADAKTLETVTCSRCGGGGNYSYCPAYGTTCFKCQGSGRVYTTRGAVALAYLVAIRSKPVGELKVGDVVKLSKSLGFGTITAIADGVEANYVRIVNNVPEPRMTGGRRITATNVETTHFNLAELVRVAQSAEQKKETYARAVAFQDTLTKAGTVRKR